MERYTIALFGEAEKGEFQIAHRCHSVEQLLDCCGNPPPYSRGIYYAVQALLYEQQLIFFRVKEEGFSYRDYLLGLDILKKLAPLTRLSAICLPGVGDTDILSAIIPICTLHHSLLITNEADLYDYLLKG